MSNALQDYLAGDDEPEMTQEESDRFTVEDEGGAEWALLKVRQARIKIHEAQELYDFEKGRIDQWLEGQMVEHSRTIDFFEGHLKRWHRGIIAREEAEGIDDKHLTKSIKLPAGTLKSRMGSPTVEFDQDAFVEWAKKNHKDWLRVKHEIEKSEAKKHLVPVVDDEGVGHVVDGSTGETVPGVTIEPGERTFSVEVQ